MKRKFTQGKKLKRTAAAALAMTMLFTTGCSNAKQDDNDSHTVATESEQSAVKEGVTVTPASFEGLEQQEASIYVSPIEGMTDEFARGVDISSYRVEKDSGVVYKDWDGNELDDAGFFKLLADSGINYVRVRVWNNPVDSDGNYYGGGNNDIDMAADLGKLATDAGIHVLVDFHYSDFWADPAKQFAPKEWSHYTMDDKENAVYEYTKESVEKLLAAGVDVSMVQVGNETTTGMCGETEWDRICTLMRAGSKAIREESEAYNKDIQIVTHFTNPDSNSFPDFAKTLEENEVDYDIFATSYYPFWHGTTANLTEKLTTVAETYNKKVMVAEVSYTYTMEDGDGSGNSIAEDTTGITLNYDVSVQGQVNAVRDTMQAVVNVGEAGIGVFYWEPAWIPVNVYSPSADDAAQTLAANKEAWETYGSGWASSYASKYDPNDAGRYYGGSSWDNQAMFDFEGNPLESLNIYKYVFSGTNAELSIVKVEDYTMESGIGEPLALPETVPAILSDGSTKEIPVIWDEAAATAAQAGEAGTYEIAGTATGDDVEYQLTAHVEVLDINYIQNPGFEDAGMSMWYIDGAGVAREADNNKLSGEYSLKFWDDEAVNYTVEQPITDLPAGTYELGTYLQGGDAGNGAIFQLYITVNGETTTVDTGVTKWQEWSNPVIPNITIPEGAEVTVGIHAEAAAKAWGAWDDFYLYKRDAQ